MDRRHDPSRLRSRSCIVGLALVFFLAGAASLLSAWAARAAQEPASAEPRPVTMAVLDNFEPLCFKDASGRPAGFAVDVAERVAALAGLRLDHIFVGSWEEAIAALADGRADLVPGAAPTAGRVAQVAFSSPFMTYRFELMVLAANRGISGLGDVAGRRIGVLEGGLAAQIAREKFAAVLDVKNDIGSLLFDLQSGGIDAFFGPSAEMESLARKAGIDDRVRIAGELPFQGQRAFAVRRDDRELLERLNRAVTSVVIADEFQLVRHRWYGEPRPFWEAWRVAWLFGLVVAASVCAMALWRYYSLKAVNAALAQSVDDLKRAEASLSLAHAEIEQAFATAGTGMRVVGADYRIARVNETYAAMTGEKMAELLGRYCYESFPGCQCHTPRCTLRRILAGEDRLEQETEKTRPDGSVVPCLVIATPFHDMEGRVTGIVESFHDLTRRRQYETLREDVERIMRHDLKSPLASIISGTRYLAENAGLTGQAAHFATMVAETGTRMLRMIDLSLDLFKMETGVYRLDARPVDLTRVIENILAELEPAVASKQLAVPVAIDGEPASGRPFLVLGEELLCYSLFANLIKNAVEASPDGETVGVVLRRAQTCAEVRIRNQGSVPADMRTRFFEKYATSGKSGGTGLGAYSAKLIAETLGGGVSLDASCPGETTLTVVLPDQAAGGTAGCRERA